MTAPAIAELLKYADLQMAAEAFLVDGNGIVKTGADLTEALKAGNDHSSRFTATQTTDFLAHWEVVAQKPNTSTGFSGTLFRNKDTNELVLSFRSTEFIDDAARDNQATNTYEIKNTGFAWGQIADMEAWYAELRANPSMLGGGPFSVTGYSLGGHLATAFNILHPDAAQQVVTFNGAGVGKIKFAGDSLTSLIAEFNALRADSSLIEARFSDVNLANAYHAIRQQLAPSGWNTTDTAGKMGLLADAKSILAGYTLPTDPQDPRLPSLTQEKTQVLAVLNEIETLVKEANRVGGLNSGGSPSTSPVRVPDDQIAAQELDYRMAVKLVAQKSITAWLLAGAAQAYTGKSYLTALATNQFDVVGDTSPSAVSNSEWHIGTDVRVFIEDQPLYRGGIGAASIGESLDYGNLALLVNGYATKDFGDTHSLVLLVDSLNVQSTILQMLPQDQRSSAAATLNQTLLAASNLRRVDGALIAGSDQGKAEGDVLENMLNALADLAIGPGNYTPLKGSPDGGTWASMAGPTGYSGRNDYYALLKRVQESTFFKNAAAGSIALQLVKPSDGLADEARKDFGAFAALYSLSPFILKQAGSVLESAVGGSWGATYTQWKADKDAVAAAEATPALTFTGEWFRDRAALLVRKNYFNANDTSYDSTQPDAYAKKDALGNAIAIDYDNEDIVWQDRQTELKIQRGGLTNNTRYVIFGSDKNETDITGASRNDSLYGGGGNDIINALDGDDYLEGNSGNDVMGGGNGYDVLLGGAGTDFLNGGAGHDWLAGGAGSDTYYFEGNIGLDIIRDSDGVGLIVMGSTGAEPLSGGKKLAENVWISDDKKFTYALVEGNLVVRPATDTGVTGVLTIQNWKAGELGITLSDTPATTVPPTNTFTGDFAKKLTPEGTQYVLGTEGQYLGQYVPDGAAPGALDLITGSIGADLIQGLGGDDALLGAAGDDIIDGGEGNDVLMGGLGADALKGGAGVDLIYGSSTGSLQYPLTNTPVLEAFYPIVLGEGFNWKLTSPGLDGDGFQQVFLSNNVGRDTQPGDAGNTVEGGAGNDIIYAGTGNDVVHGGLDQDQITGMAGADVLLGDEGNDRIYGDGSATNVGALTYTPASQHGSDILIGGMGNDLLIGQGGGDALHGGIGSDQLYGDDRDNASLSGDDYLDGGSENDALFGGAGDDILIGGKDNDQLVGGAGRDIYIFNKGDGIDTVTDTKAEGNIIRFGAGAVKENVTLKLGSLLVDLGDGDQVHIEGFNQDDARGTVAIDSFEFADGSTWTPDDLLDRGFDLAGTAGNDSIRGTSVTDRIRGFAGNDILEGGADDDALDGGTGNDILRGGLGGDTYTFGIGHGQDVVNDVGGGDSIVFGQGITAESLVVSLRDGLLLLTLASGDSVSIEGEVAEYRFIDGTVLTREQVMALLPPTEQPLQPLRLLGTEGNDTLSGGAEVNYILGAGGDDAIDGGAGDDYLFGDAGNDTMHGGAGADGLAGGDGLDVLYGDAGSDRLWGNAGDDSLYGGDGDDELSAGDGIDLLVGGRGNDLLMAAGTGTKTYRFDVGDGNDVVSTTSAARRMEFGQGILPGDIKVFKSPAGVSPSYVVVQYGATDTVMIQLGTGSLPEYRFDNGTVLTHATLVATYGQSAQPPSMRVGTSGNDDLSASQAGTLEGGGGNDWLSGSNFDDILAGGSGADSLYGNAGNDVLKGGQGNDTLDGGPGNDTYVYSSGDGNDTISDHASAGEVNVLRVTDLNAGDVVYTRESNGSLLIRIKGSSGSLEVRNWYSDPARRLQQIIYADGSSPDLVALGNLPQVRISGTNGADVLAGTPYADIIDGLAGNDSIDGGPGNDSLSGGDGSDTYLVRRGMGIDVIQEGAGTINVLKLGIGLGFDQLVEERQGNDLYLHLTASTDGVVLKDYFNGAGSWLVELESGQQKTVGDVIAENDARAPAVTAQQLRDEWVVYAKTAMLQIIAADLGSKTWEQTGPFSLISTDKWGSWTNNFAESQQTSDDAYIERISWGWDTAYDVESWTKTYDIALPTSRFNATTGGSAIWHVEDYGNLDAMGQPTITVFGLPNGPALQDLSHYEGVRVLTQSAPAPPASGYIVVPVTEVISNSIQTGTFEIITAGASDNFIYTYDGLGTVDAGAGNDVIFVDGGNGWSGDGPGQFMDGGAGNDVLLGSYNDDVLIDGAGDDYLAGGMGHDRYHIGAGDVGTKIIDEVTDGLKVSGWLWSEDASQWSTDTVRFGQGIELSDVRVTRGSYTNPHTAHYAGGWVNNPTDFETLDISWGTGSTARVLLADSGYESPDNDGFGIEFFEFADGTRLSLDAFVDSTSDQPNAPPVASQPIAQQSLAEDVAWSFTVPVEAFSDPDDGDTLTYSATSTGGPALPNWLSFDAATRTFSGTPANADVGDLGIELVASDSSGASASTVFGITVANANDAPALAQPIASQSTNEDQFFSFSVPAATFLDVDAGDTLTYRASLADGSALPSWIDFDAQALVFSGTPGSADLGSISLKLTATDSAGATASATFGLNVAHVNHAPVIAQVLPGQEAVASQSWSYSVPSGAFGDPDSGDTLTYSASLADGSALPSWLVFNAVTQTFSGIPASGDAGLLPLQVIGTDAAGAVASQFFNLGISPVPGLNLVGTSAADTLTGGAGDDRINGLGGADTLRGLQGNDTYVVDNAKDVVTEAVDQGFDRIESAVTYTAPANVEAITLTGTANIRATGNALDNELVGNAGANTLDGALGADTLRGGLGNDTYIVNDAGDLVIELTGEGTDTVQSSVSYTLASNVENLTLTGTASIAATGNELNNTLTANAAGSVLSGLAGNDILRGGLAADALYGGDGNDRLDGGEEADQMAGGSGNDTYVVDNAGDVATELAGEGTDLVQSSVSYVLGANLENLTLTGAESLAATGNDLNNTITANAAASVLRGLGGNDVLRGAAGADTLYGGEGNDRLDGGAAADQLFGGLGNDTYVVNDAGDAVNELASEGTDLVQSSIIYALGSDVENLTLTGTASITGTGNDLNNTMVSNAIGSTLWGMAGNDTLRGAAGADVLFGGEGNDRLDGGLGADQLTGGAGNDIYVVNDAGDTVSEQPGEGTDVVQSSVSYTLGTHLENLTLTGTAAISGTGNELGNVIVGNSAANSLRGLEGDDTINGGASNDTLDGGIGADRLNGGLGADTYLFGRGDGSDRLTDVDATAGVQDVLQLGSGIAADQLWLRKLGSNLEVSVIGTLDKMTITGWYTDSAHHVEVMQLANGQRLLDSQVQNLVQAMASFAPPAQGETTLSPTYQQQLGGVIASNWQ